MERSGAGWAYPTLLIAVWALTIAVPGDAVRAQVPRWTLTDFPRYPGEIQVPFAQDVEPCVAENCLRYESGDPPAKVIQFYEARLGRHAITVPDVSTMPAGSQAIVLQGTPAEPRKAVAVMPGGTGNPPTSSVIIIRKPPR